MEINTLKDAAIEKEKMQYEINKILSAFTAKFPEFHIIEIEVSISTMNTQCGAVRDARCKIKAMI